MRPLSPVQTDTASAPPSDRSDHAVGAKLTIDVGAPAAPRGPSGTATKVMSPDTSARATMSVVPVGRHPVMSGLKTCARSVMRVGNTGPVGEAVAAVGEAVAALGVVLGAMAEVGVGDRTADAAAGRPDEEQAEITTTRPAAIAFRTRRA
jgi:hypothetical protein